MGVFGTGYGYISSPRITNSPFPAPAKDIWFPLNHLPPKTRLRTCAFPKSLRTPRTYEWHFGIDQSLGRSQQLSVAYVGGAGRELIYWHAYDVGVPVVQAYSNDARSDYHALLLEYVRRRTRGSQASVS